MVPEGWSEETIATVLRRITKPVKVEPDKRYQQIGIRSHGKGVFDKPPVLGQNLGNKRVFWIEPNCFVVNIVFAWEQAVGRTYDTDIGKIASHRFPMYAPRNAKADIDYVTYFFKTPRGKHLLGQASPGGAGRNKTLGQKEFDRLLLCLPPIEEQEKIAQLLLTWDRAVETVDQLIENSERQKKAMMQQLFASRSAASWPEVELGALGTFKKGRGISRDQVVSEGLPCVRYGEIYTQHHTVIRAFTSFIAPEVATTATKICKGDLLFAGSGETAEEIGKCVAFLGDHDAYAGGDIVILSTHQGDPAFLAYQLSDRSAIRQMMRFAQGNSVVHISAANLSKVRLRLPTQQHQIKIASLLAGLDRLIANYRKQREILLVERRGFMQQLLTGKRRVRIDEAIERVACA